MHELVAGSSAWRVRAANSKVKSNSLALKYLKIVDKKSNSDDIIDVGDIIKIKVIYDIDDIEEYTIKLTGKYMIDNNAKIKEVSLNSPIGRSIYLKSINDNDICYYVNDKKIGIKIIKRIYEN